MGKVSTQRPNCIEIVLLGDYFIHIPSLHIKNSILLPIEPIVLRAFAPSFHLLRPIFSFPHTPLFTLYYLIWSSQPFKLGMTVMVEAFAQNLTPEEEEMVKQLADAVADTVKAS